MTLEYIANGITWLGEPINDVRHPKSIERLWTTEQLAEIGLRVRVPPPPQQPTLTAVRTDWVNRAWQRAMGEIEVAIVTVPTSHGDLLFGCDAVTQDNLQKAILGVLTGMTPNPRPWTPKGHLEPVMLTHDDIKAAASAVGARYDATIQAYLAHKAQILSSDHAALAAYNLDTGWPQ